MKEYIRTQLTDPAKLEALYRSDKSHFKQAFNALYPEISEDKIAQYWHARLNFNSPSSLWPMRQEVIFVLIVAIIAGFIVKLPAIFGINEDFFYPRNLGFIVFPPLVAYFSWKNKLSWQHIGVMSLVFLAAVVFINYLPDNSKSNTLILSCIHLMVVLWAVLAAAFSAGAEDQNIARMAFLRYNGDLLVMGGLILTAGGLMSALTVGLFKVIGFQIDDFYFSNIVPVGLAAVPLVATCLIRLNPQLVGKVAPVIARLFSPLVLVMLIIYLGAMIFSGKDPYNDRDFLMIFNALLIGVMALIFFSMSEAARQGQKNWELWMLFLLAMVTVLVNGIALSAIIFRIAEWGITPNRAAVLGSNTLMLVHLLWISWMFLQVLRRKKTSDSVSRVVAIYLPVYILWAVAVSFLFPLIFNFK